MAVMEWRWHGFCLDRDILPLFTWLGIRKNGRKKQKTNSDSKKCGGT